MLKTLLIRGILSALAMISLMKAVEAQKADKADSIYLELLMSPDDTNLILQLQREINNFVFSQPDTALFYANRMFIYAEAAGYDYGIAQAINMQGLSYEMNEQFDSARKKYKRASELALKHNYAGLLIRIYNNLSILESTLGNYEISLEYLLKALDLAEQHNDSSQLAALNNNIGLRYSELHSQEKALQYFTRAIPLYIAAGREHKLDNTFSNLGRSYYILEAYDSAEQYYRKALPIARQNSNNLVLINSNLGLGMVYAKTGRLDSAMIYQQKGKEIAEKSGDEYGVAQALLIAGEINATKGNLARAEKDLLQSLDIADRLGIKPLQVDLYNTLSEMYSKKGDFRNALKYSKMHSDLQDQLYRNEKDKALQMASEYQEEKDKKEKELLSQEIELERIRTKQQRSQRNLFIIAGVLLLLIAGGLFHRFIYVRRTKDRLAEQNAIIQEEKRRSDDLLLNILPQETAQELKSKGSADSRQYDMVTVFFSDFVGFTELAGKMSPSDLVSQIDIYFREFDNIITRHGIEKIKTIGDAYMCAGGLPVPNETHALDVVGAAIEIRDFIQKQEEERTAKDLPAFRIRIGIHTGPVVAGIVGIKKFAYDIWGDTVNIASRMESAGEPGMINISQSTYNLVHDRFKCVHRGRIEAKGKGEIDMYYVVGL